MTRVADLAGAELALWVARVRGVPAYIVGEVCRLGYDSETHNGRPVVRERYQPHEDWSQGGPMIEKHHIELTDERLDENDKHSPWSSYCEGEKSTYRQAGPTPLIAAMRALVASVYGEEVPNENI